MQKCSADKTKRTDKKKIGGGYVLPLRHVVRLELRNALPQLIVRDLMRSKLPCNKNAYLFLSAFPMFVPSLSW
eukprot:COSAG06_NODE_4520_length_4185_cov_13.400147_1_plen_73_part_00